MSTTKPVTKALAIAFSAAFALGLFAQLLPGSEHTAAESLPSAAPIIPANATPTNRARHVGDRSELAVSRQSFNGEWPLVHDEAIITCTPRERPFQHLSSATAVIAGREYRLNGMAIGYPELGALWLDDESIPGAKVTITDLIQAALALCVRDE